MYVAIIALLSFGRDITIMWVLPSFNLTLVCEKKEGVSVPIMGIPYRSTYI